MEKIPKNKEQLKEVTVSLEIREALSSKWLKEEDVRLVDYIRMKTELRRILTPVGIWSAEFDAWIDRNINGISSLGKWIDEIGKWMERIKNPHKKEELERLRSHAKRDLERMAGWSPAFESWLKSGSSKDLQKVGEYMDYMGRVDSIIGAIRFMKDMNKNKPR